MIIDDKYKNIVIDALQSYYASILSTIVTREKYNNNIRDEPLRQLKGDIATLLKQFDEF